MGEILSFLIVFYSKKKTKNVGQLAGARMQRISIPWLVDFTDQLETVSNSDLTAFSPSQARTILFELQTKLKMFQNDSIYRPYVRTSRENLYQLDAALEAIIRVSDINTAFGSYELHQVQQKVSEFRKLLLAELGSLPIYLVPPKDNYDTNLLTDNGAGLFPQDMLAKVPETNSDSSECGKALAYNLPTATGFHVFRLTESVLRKYWSVISDGATPPRNKSIGSFAEELKQKELGEEKVWETLKQMAKLHRNPLVHPEVILSHDEAIEIIGIARSAISAMLRSIPVPAPTISTQTVNAPV